MRKTHDEKWFPSLSRKLVTVTAKGRNVAEKPAAKWYRPTGFGAGPRLARRRLPANVLLHDHEAAAVRFRSRTHTESD